MKKKYKNSFSNFLPRSGKGIVLQFFNQGFIYLVSVDNVHTLSDLVGQDKTVKIVLPHYYSISHTPHTHSMRRVLEKEVKLTHHKKITTSASTSKYGFKYDADQNNIANQPSDFFFKSGPKTYKLWNL